MNRNLIRLGNAIKNTNISKLSKNELEHFNQLKSNYIKALNSPNAKNFSHQDLDNLLKNYFKIENTMPYQIKPGQSDLVDHFNIELKPLPDSNMPLLTHKLPNFKDIPKSNIYAHDKIPHYKSIVGFTIENGKTYVLVTNWTTTDKPVTNVIQGFKLDDIIDPEHLINLLSKKDQHLLNYKTYYKGGDFEQDIIKRLPIKRDSFTWAAGEYGDLGLIPIGKTVDGKNQYSTLVVQKYALEDLNIYFILGGNIPSLTFKNFLLNHYQNLKSMYIFNPLNKGTYEEIDIKQINFVDPQKLTTELTDLQNPIKIEDTILLANIKGKTLIDFYKEKGLLIEINPETQELINESTEFNTLPPIEGPRTDL